MDRPAALIDDLHGRSLLFGEGGQYQSGQPDREDETLHRILQASALKIPVGVPRRQPSRCRTRASTRETRIFTGMTHEHDLDAFDPELAELDDLSNRALDLIERGRFAEAERICLQLKTRFPDQIDGMERSAELAEARGETQGAIAHYEQCLAHIGRYPDGFDPDSGAWYRERIEHLRRRAGSPVGLAGSD